MDIVKPRVELIQQPLRKLRTSCNITWPHNLPLTAPQLPTHARTLKDNCAIEGLVFNSSKLNYQGVHNSLTYLWSSKNCQWFADFLCCMCFILTGIDLTTFTNNFLHRSSRRVFSFFLLFGGKRFNTRLFMFFKILSIIIVFSLFNLSLLVLEVAFFLLCIRECFHTLPVLVLLLPV